MSVNELTFDEWSALVDEAVGNLTEGLSQDDLEDWCSHDEWVAGTSPEDAAQMCVANDTLWGPALGLA